MPIPNDSEPYATLDLYEWTGSPWQFVPGHVIREDDTVLSELNRVPASFMVMQTDSVPPTAAAVVPEGQTLPDAGRDARAEYEAGHIPGARFFDIDAISDDGPADEADGAAQ